MVTPEGSASLGLPTKLICKILVSPLVISASLPTVKSLLANIFKPSIFPLELISADDDNSPLGDIEKLVWLPSTTENAGV